MIGNATRDGLTTFLPVWDMFYVDTFILYSVKRLCIGM
jgi:hypothetical protein